MGFIHSVERELSPFLAGSKTFNTTGFSASEPIKCVIIRTLTATAIGTEVAGEDSCVSGTDGTNHQWVRNHAQSGSSFPACNTSATRAGGPDLIELRDNSDTVILAADFVSIGTNSITIDFTTAPASPGVLLEFTFLGGSDAFFDIQVPLHPAGADHVVSGLSFEPVFWMAYGAGCPIPQSILAVSQPGMGFAGKNYGGTITQAAVGVARRSSASPTDPTAIHKEDVIHVQPSRGNNVTEIDATSKIASPTSSGYTVERGGLATGNIILVSMGFSVPRTASAGLFTMSTGAAPRTEEMRDACHTSEIVFTAFGRSVAVDDTGGDDRDQSADAAVFGHGVASSHNGKQVCLVGRYEDNVTTSSGGIRADDALLLIPNPDGTLTAGAVRGEFAGGIAGGFAVNLDLNDTGTARKFVWGSIGDTYIVKPDPVVLTLSVPAPNANTLGYIAPAPVGLMVAAPAPNVLVPRTQTPDPVTLPISVPQPFTGVLLPTPLLLSVAPQIPDLIAPMAAPAPAGAQTATYLRMLQDALPRGLAWTRREDATLTKLLTAMAEEFARVQVRADALLAEADPRMTLELLRQWEDALGLPDPCINSPRNSIVIRRNAVVSRLSSEGGQSVAFFVALAASLGFTITATDIIEYREFKCDVSTVDTPLYSEDWMFVWEVHAPVATPTFFRAGVFAAGEPIVTFGNDPLTCAFEKAKPAHTKVLFVFDRPLAGSWAPWETLYPDPVALTLSVPQPLRST